MNTPEKFYDDLLPLLLDKPLDVAIMESNSHLDDLACPFRTNQRAVVTGYRCVREAWIHYLNAHGVSSEHSLQVRAVHKAVRLRGLGRRLKGHGMTRES